MKSVGIKTRNRRLSEYARLAASGESILVTDGDRVLAEFGPLREERTLIRANAVRSGMLTPPALAASGLPLTPLPVNPLHEILGELDDNRRDR